MAARNFVQPDAPRYRVYIGNLPKNCLASNIEHIFEGCKIAEVHMVRNPETDEFRGFAYVELKDQDSYNTALSCDGVLVNGVPIRVNDAERRGGRGGPGGRGGRGGNFPRGGEGGNRDFGGPGRDFDNQGFRDFLKSGEAWKISLGRSQLSRFFECDRMSTSPVRKHNANLSRMYVCFWYVRFFEIFRNDFQNSNSSASPHSHSCKVDIAVICPTPSYSLNLDGSAILLRLLRNHLKGVRHVQLRAEYLQRFQDPKSVLLTEKGKPLCISFAKTGVCQFGQCCRYSHLTPELESRLNYQIAQQRQFSVTDPVQAARDLEERVKQRLAGLRDSESPAASPTSSLLDLVMTPDPDEGGGETVIDAVPVYMPYKLTYARPRPAVTLLWSTRCTTSETAVKLTLCLTCDSLQPIDEGAALIGLELSGG
nr:unnamed protein product [Spirometra erinaceieuropaei]